jgi:GDP-mannose pyrophosphatase NudK
MSNPNVRIIEKQVLSSNWYTLNKLVFDYRTKNGEWVRQSREAYDRGNGAVILLYNTEKQTVILTEQFRMPTYINGNNTGMLIEACAGLLDADSPEVAIKRETEEETGFVIQEVKKVYEAYMSPGSVTEILYFFIAAYTSNTKNTGGGGVDHEDITTHEFTFETAIQMISDGSIKDAKTIMLLQYLAIHKVLMC